MRPFLPADHIYATDGALLSSSADHQLGNDQRRSQDQDADDIDQNESPAAVFTGDVREAPKVAQADGAADGREEERDSRRPGLVFER